jgi:hypothetical protein
MGWVSFWAIILQTDLVTPTLVKLLACIFGPKRLVLIGAHLRNFLCMHFFQNWANRFLSVNFSYL